MHFVSESSVPDRNTIEEYMAFKPEMDVLVYLRVPIEICLERIQMRGFQGRLVDMNLSERTDFIRNTNEVLEFGVEHLTKRGIDVISIDAGAESSKVIDQLETLILERLEI